MSQPTKIAGRADEIRRLRGEGLTLREICERLGVAKSIVNRALYERVREYEKDYNRERFYTNKCERCGKPCTFNRFAKAARGRWCAACYRLRPESAHSQQETT